MSRTPITFDIPDPPRELDSTPNIKGKAAAAKWLQAELKVPVTERYIANATNRREIEHAKIMGACYYSELGLWRFIMSKQVPVGAAKSRREPAFGREGIHSGGI